MNTLYKLPTLVMRGLVLLPNVELKLEVGRSFSKAAIDDAKDNFEGRIFVTTQKNPFEEKMNESNVYRHGVVAKIVSKITLPNGNYRITLVGITRAVIDLLHIEELENGAVEATIIEEKNVVRSENEEIALMRKLMEYVDVYVDKLSVNTEDILNKITGATTPDVIVDIIAFNLPLSIERLQTYVEETDINQRIFMLIKDLENEKEISEIEAEIDAKIRKGMEDSQREYYLREKMRIIREELGDVSSKDAESDDIRKKIDETKLPEVVKEKVLAELRRYEGMPSNAQEASIIKTYLDLILALPWGVVSKDQTNIKKVEEVLDASHYGLDKVKDRILDYIAVKQMTKSLKSPILCLIGPPGTGKTSLATSVAKALNRNFVKVSLGGVRDESEIRGHRRTYLGAMPGRIIQGMKNAKTVNPVFLLDEIDKMSSDFRGDPASAMLEVLDPEQNSHFSDHYLEEEYDLSNVMFIATANYRDQIPEPLYDRMEIIDLSGYTDIEKLNIADKHLLPRQLKNHGLNSKQLEIVEEGFLKIIRNYTREAGVRQLEREISKVCRKTAREILTKKAEKVKMDKIIIDAKTVEKYLGKIKVDFRRRYSHPTVGVVTGLAYTAFGGDILPIEANYYKGDGKITLTGQLGDVMQESAKIALSYIKANSELFEVDYKLLSESNIHIHAPEGAVPKDGPSAGITLTTAIISSLTNREVDNSVGMTGEITLHGKVLPIGGLKEKAISAHRSGIRKIIVPNENERDIVDIPKEVLDEMEIVFVNDYSEVYSEVLK